MSAATTTNTKTLPQLPVALLLGELFERVANRQRVLGLALKPLGVPEVTECGQMTGSCHDCCS